MPLIMNTVQTGNVPTFVIRLKKIIHLRKSNPQDHPLQPTALIFAVESIFIKMVATYLATINEMT